MAQMVERVLGKDEVTGSIPVISSIKKERLQNICKITIPFNKFTFLGCSWAFCNCTKVNCFQQVCFSLCIFAKQNIKVRRKIHLFFGVVSIVCKFNSVNFHFNLSPLNYFIKKLENIKIFKALKKYLVNWQNFLKAI